MDGKWEYTSAETARAEAGFDTAETCMWRRQIMVGQYIAMQSLLDLWEATEKNQGSRVGTHWWEQAGIDLSVARETTTAAAEAEKYGLEE